jgi:hypothetical protein
MEPTPANIEQFRARLIELLQSVTDNMQYLKFDKELPPHVTAACIYATIVQSSRECFSLLSTPTVTVGGALRGIIESWSDLSAVIKDGKYVNRMLATFLAEKLRYMNSMIKSPHNPFFVEMSKHLDPEVEKAKVTVELAALEGSCYKRLSSAERLKAGDITDIYEGFYWQLCLHSHNNAGALEIRHILKTETGFEVMLCNPNSTIELVNYFDPLLVILIDSTIKIHSYLNTGIAPQFEQRRTEFDAFRKAVLAGTE